MNSYIAAATKTRATAPEGANVVNSTNVTSLNAVSNPEIISFPLFAALHDAKRA